MKKTLLLIIVGALLLFTACDAENNRIYFNKSEDYVTSGPRLVDPIIVNETEFHSNYYVDASNLTGNTDWKVQYRLEYAWNLVTGQADLTSLSDGVITVTENDRVIFVMYISDVKQIVCYAVNEKNIQISRINNVEMRLYNLTKEKSSILYGEFKLGEYFITCSMYDKTQSDMVNLLSSLLSNNIGTKADSKS